MKISHQPGSRGNRRQFLEADPPASKIGRGTVDIDEFW
jgi:hypothetical protein